MGNKLVFNDKTLCQLNSFNEAWVEAQKIRKYLEIILNCEIIVLTQGGTWTLNDNDEMRIL